MDFKDNFIDRAKACILFMDMPSVADCRGFPGEAGQPMPRGELILDEQTLGIARDELLRRLAEGTPAVSLTPSGPAGIFVIPQALRPGEEAIVMERIPAILRADP